MPGRWCWDNDHEIAIITYITGHRVGAYTGVLPQPMAAADHTSPRGGGAIVSFYPGKFIADRGVYYTGGRVDRAVVWAIKSIFGAKLKFNLWHTTCLKGKKGSYSGHWMRIPLRGGRR
jgi:hypothetical protein